MKQYREDYPSDYLAAEMLAAMALREEDGQRGTPSDLCLQAKSMIDELVAKGIAWHRIRHELRDSVMA